MTPRSTSSRVAIIRRRRRASRDSRAAIREVRWRRRRCIGPETHNTRKKIFVPPSRPSANCSPRSPTARKCPMRCSTSRALRSSSATTAAQERRSRKSSPSIRRRRRPARHVSGCRAASTRRRMRSSSARHQGIEGHAADPAVLRALWARAEELLPRAEIEPYTQALMDLGAMVCLRSTPDCARCPVAADCVAWRENRIDELPLTRPRQPLPQREVAVLLIERGGEILLERRPPIGIWAGLWSLPEVACANDVTAYCRDRFGAEVAAGVALMPIDHGFTHFRLRLTPLPCSIGYWPTRVDDSGHSACVWLPLPEATSAALSAPIKKLLRSLATQQATV